MKVIHKIIISLCISLILFSCDESVLDLKPLDSVSEVDVFNDEALLQAYVNATYSGIYHMHEANYLGTVGYEDLCFFKKTNADGFDTYLEGRIDETNGEGVSRGRWSRCYGYIRHINSYFEKTESSSISETTLESMDAEMHFMRAYYYFELMKWYGKIPLVKQRYELEDKDVRLPRSPLDEVVAFIVEDLDKVINSSLAVNTTPARASKGAAMAMKGRVLLYAASKLFNPNNDQAKWSAAATANKAVMDLAEYPLADDYGKMFNTSSYLDPEVIFAKEYNKTISQGQWSGANTLLLPNGFEGWQNATPTQTFVDMFDMKDGQRPFLSDGSVNPSSGYDPHDPYVNRDPRMDAIVFYNGMPFKDRNVEYWIQYEDDGDGSFEGRTPLPNSEQGKDTRYGNTGHEYSHTGYAWRKHTDESLSVDYAGVPLVYTPDVLYRKAEFYLNYAETQIALGNEAEARTAINVIRGRTGVELPEITYTGGELLEAYRRERAIELSFEDHRFHDIRRWEIAEDVMGKPKKGVWIEKLSTGDLVYNYNRVAEDSKLHVWDNKMYWMPIPQSEMTTAEGEWQQNPGY
ncbi:RagB/SusD family nutrient uptake outer membrane protein [Carboxylicivirga sediminis]|uniref:RagB/SusD family nutrient uptake outer membrane protein n=1 Tax=Carboxylicivirga sediminis TaxID=2006564 RepID=A0A941IXV9_9BACT|nr:RagB/SusD family nutrient uptake outer membrane protein [Carboxylicivirga sediminis]MBR8535859.1 RagB/SusD family nutrient uptake outer membrane protein [Carboxylicivirga sediminis]